VSTRALHHFEAAVLETVRCRRLLRPDEHVLAALSGGPDSTALVAVLCALRDARLMGTVSACHIDHGLRAGSAQDGEFCAVLCDRLSVALERVAVKVDERGNLQDAARRARYRALGEAAERAGAHRVATGHTLSDQAETVLHRILRGAGARGLAAIPAQRGALVRPLIDRSRSEVLAYLDHRHIQFREDPTNATPRFLRNRIRAEIVPLLKELSPSVERQLARTADLLREDDRALEELATHAVPVGALRADLASLLVLPGAVCRRAVRRLWQAANSSEGELCAHHVEAILRLVTRQQPGRIALPGGIEARVGRGLVELGLPEQAPAPVPCVLILGPGRYPIPKRDACVELSWTSDEPPPWPLELRGRRPGDRFRPEGGRGKKKLKAWLIDRKVPRLRRDELVVVATLRGEVLAIPELGMRAADVSSLEARWCPL